MANSIQVCNFNNVKRRNFFCVFRSVEVVYVSFRTDTTHLTEFLVLNPLKKKSIGMVCRPLLAVGRILVLTFFSSFFVNHFLKSFVAKEFGI